MSGHNDEIREYYAAEQEQIRQNYEDEHQRQLDDQAREDQEEQQRRQWRDWDDEAATNLAHQQQEEADREISQQRRSADNETMNQVAWLIGALVGLAFVLPILAATVIWQAVVLTIQWALHRR